MRFLDLSVASSRNTLNNINRSRGKNASNSRESISMCEEGEKLGYLQTVTIFHIDLEGKKEKKYFQTQEFGREER